MFKSILAIEKNKKKGKKPAFRSQILRGVRAMRLARFIAKSARTKIFSAYKFRF
ncbi:MAG: hypothetical protein HC817_09050 [Saprospiraceae bacterium]|nr:hypothetical protein [Saprospiraceae bacterium]